ncbi:MAG: putative toxin-antitoxin system toxin component, PIN family [Bacteroidetes bacterium GWA2_31_9]|nr:MAG: putative toxin-antitoxin system toxin component, PIN family [Bacteroidetes bacterium GWA2_31_9]
MNTTELKLVIDTNVLLAIIGKKSPYRWVFDRIISGEYFICLSNTILFEYHEILQQKSCNEVAENIMYFLSVHPFSEKVEPFYNFNLIDNDTDDNKFVDCAVAADAFCINRFS